MSQVRHSQGVDTVFSGQHSAEVLRQADGGEVMTHVNKDGKHEFLTHEQYEQKYGQLPISRGPHYSDGKVLAKLREAEDVTVRELAKAMGTTPSWVSAVEMGREEVTAQIREAYQKGLLDIELKRKI